MGLFESSPNSSWEVVAAVLLCVAAPLVIFAPTFGDMVGTWRRSETYAHCFLVFPAFAYMVWRQRAELKDCPVRPAPIALLGAFGAGLLWALGSLSAALAPSFFGLIGLSISSVIAVLGWRVARAIWVPLLFLFFAAPFGEVFVPYLVEWTADFTVAALKASGVPVFREGQSFVIPSGHWSVVDACSGIRYLMASMFVGWLFAWLAFRSTARRLAFMAASVIVPIVANWLRAYLIVMLGHLSSNKLAGGVDHLIYGWVFFGAVMLLLLWAGNRFREDGPERGPSGPARPSPAASPVDWRSTLPMALAVIAVSVGWQTAAGRLAATGDKRPVDIQPVQAANGWTPVMSNSVAWTPKLRAPAATLLQQFEKQGQRVAVFIGIYRNQDQHSELVNSLNEMSHQIGTPWLLVAETSPTVDLGRASTRINRALGRRYSDVLGVWQWYWIHGRTTTSDASAKASLAIDRLLGRGDTSAWVAVYVIGADEAVVDQRLKTFAADMGPAIDEALHRTAER